MEVAFVLDTTGSMSGMIDGAKRKIWAIANKLKSAEPVPEVRFGLVAYRDRGDEYVTRVHPLSQNLDQVYETLHGFQATGGGDEPESVNEALHRAVSDMQWSEDSKVLRVIFLVGDAPPHMDYRDDVRFYVSCALAKRQGILVNTLQCGDHRETEVVWRAIARRTGGTYARLLHDGGSIRIETPHDTEILRLNLALDATIIPYGTEAERANAARNRMLLDGLSAEAVADRSSFLGKMEPGAVIVSRGDLVIEIMSDRMQLASVDLRLLDPAVARMFAPERDAFILQKVEERRALLSELAILVASRDELVAQQLRSMHGTDEVLELNAFEVLETQAGARGFNFPRGW